MDPKALQSAAAARGSNYYLTGIPDGPLPFVFEAGLPDPTTFPSAELGRLFTDVLGADAAELQYGSPIDGDLGYGNIGLRRLLAQRTLEIDGRAVDHAGVMLTSGGVQGIAEAVAAFLDPGDHAVVEAPTWDYTLRAIQATGAEATAIPIDDHGMQIDLLEQHIARLAASGERLKLVYIIATFNVPTAVSLSEERRRRLVTLAQEHRFVIIEDNVYADLRYDGERLPSLYSLDDAGFVVKVDSFSKTMMPALRLGWVTGDPAAIDAMARVRRDLGVSQLIARAIARFVGEGRYEPHIASVCKLYRTKRDAVAAALEQHCTGTMTWNNPAGGYFFWLELADDIDGKAVQRAAFMEGVLCRPGERFYGEPEHGKQRLRLAFTMAPVADLERAVEILGKSAATNRR
ncbi:MAG: PLP-dependent aminotransferase family protein [Acidimicrobiia bacterium]